MQHLLQIHPLDPPSTPLQLGLVLFKKSFFKDNLQCGGHKGEFQHQGNDSGNCSCCQGNAQENTHFLPHTHKSATAFVELLKNNWVKKKWFHLGHSDCRENTWRAQIHPDIVCKHWQGTVLFSSHNIDKASSGSTQTLLACVLRSRWWHAPSPTKQYSPSIYLDIKGQKSEEIFKTVRSLSCLPK